MKSQDATGISLKRIAAYLPYGIWIQHELPNAGFERGLWVGYDANRLRGIKMQFADGSISRYKLAQVLPILRPFSAMCDTMPDGKVPAVEVAKYIYSLSDNPIELDEHENVHAGFGHFQELVVMVGGCGLICIYPDWRIDTYGNCLVPPLVYDYLRSLHFAVGLEPHEFIEKAAPTPTIQGGGKSHE